MGNPVGFASEPGGLGSASCGGGAAAWVAGFLAAPGTQRSWRLGPKEIQCFRRVWTPVMTNTFQYSCLGNAPLTEKPGRPQPTRSQRIGHNGKRPHVHRWEDFFFFLHVAALPQ